MPKKKSSITTKNLNRTDSFHIEDIRSQAFSHTINSQIQSNPANPADDSLVSPSAESEICNLAWEGGWKINKESEPEWPLIRLVSPNPVKQPPWCMLLLHSATPSNSNFLTSHQPRKILDYTGRHLYSSLYGHWKEPTNKNSKMHKNAPTLLSDYVMLL